MTAAVRAEPAERGSHHAHEAFAVGAERGQLDVGRQFGVALADAGGVEVDVHAAQTPGQFTELLRGIVACDVDDCGFDLGGCQCLELCEGLGVPACGTHAPAGADAEPGHLEAQAGGGANDDDTLHGCGICQSVSAEYCTHSMPTLRSRFNPSSER